MVQVLPPPPPSFLPPWEETRAKFSHKQGRIEIAVFVTFLAFTAILVLGRLRPRGSTWMKIVSSMLALGADKLITYITGLMGQLSDYSDLYVLWVAFLAYLSTLTTNSSCYTLVDNEEQLKSLVLQYTVAWGLIVGTLQASLAAPEIMVPVAFMFWITVLKIRERRRALLAATRSSFGISKATKVISDFSNYKEKEGAYIESGPQYFVALRDDTHRVRYRMSQKQYKTKKKDGIVGFAPDHFITTKDVLDITQEQGMEVTETCFSFAMFWLLLARVAGYYNVDVRVDFDKLLNVHKKDEEIHPKEENSSTTPPPLNSKDEEEKEISVTGGERELSKEKEAERKLLKQKEEAEGVILFRLVEQELEFLYDYIYTNSYAIYARGVCKKIVDIGIIVLFFLLALPLIVEYRTQDRNIVYVQLWGHVVDTGLARFVILAVFVSEFVQLGMFLASKWGKVVCTCARLRRKGSTTSTNINTSTLTTIVSLIEIWMVQLVKFVSLIPCPTFKFACRGKSTCLKVKLGQYSLIKNYKKIPSLLWFSCWISGYIDMPRWGQTGKEDIELSLELKRAVVSCLNGWEQRHRKITKGEASLKANGVSDEIIRDYLGDYTRLQSQARVILIWHIATSRFEEDPSTIPDDPENNEDFQVATKFSKYCAYLVALNPQMIPGHGGDVHTVECEFDQVVRELKLKYKRSGKDDNHQPDEEKLVDGDQEPILSEGDELSKVLYSESHNNKNSLWKALAEFWTELLLFLALCSDRREVMDAHANRLTLGGEFITHLWALLMHKGYQRKIATITSTGKKTQASTSDEADESFSLSKIPEALSAASGYVEVVGDFVDQFSSV